ncbi:signal peptidase I [Melittangium boletus]|uniref:Signal peptidase I n=1 Tax=Melittangium boletus DSM 14713 TaxID=1294270 RepID=A0A250IRI9_9BACT|nr:signal peptidase I [Melittangium boletus]ATB33771.1 hypothetical protein MEBOL_007269 [Melittangium boletus DSM 14713]
MRGMSPSLPVSRWRRVLAVLLSITPGCGHVLLGRWRRGLVWLGAMLLAQASIAFLGFAGLVITLGGMLGAAVDVVRLPPRETGVPRAGWVVLTLVGFWMVASLVGMTTRTWLAEPFTVPSVSMLPTLLPGDHFYTDKRVASPWRRPVERGEVIVFRPPPQPEVRYVMRAVALAGDTVAVRCGRLSLDGQEVERRTLGDCVGLSGVEDSCQRDEELLGEHPHGVLGWGSCMSAMDFPSDAGCPEKMETREAGCVVPEGHVFVLGDNRDNASDSRFWGPLPVEEVVGAARFIHFSWRPGGEGIRWGRIGTEVR